MEALEAIHQGRHTATPTASGKTLIYALACLEQLLGRSGLQALFLFPIKALEQDQRKALEEWGPFFPGRPQGAIGHLRCDTPPSDRREIRRAPLIVISNPDMLPGTFAFPRSTWEGIF